MARRAIIGRLVTMATVFGVGGCSNPGRTCLGVPLFNLQSSDSSLPSRSRGPWESCAPAVDRDVSILG
jgi:hypothetical protein